MREIPFISENDIVTESFLSPSKFIDIIFSSYIKVISTMNNTYNEAVKNYVKTLTQFINDNRVSLGGYNKEFSFTRTIYDVDALIPTEGPIQSWVEKYKALQTRLPELTLADLKEIQAEVTSTTFMDNVRGQILKRGPVTATEFKEVANNIFIKGEEDILVNKDYIMGMIKNTDKVKKGLDNIYTKGLRLNAIVGEIETERMKVSRAADIELKSNLLKVTNLSSKHKGKLTKEQQIVAYNLDVVFLQTAHTILSLMSLVHNIKIHAALSSVKQDMYILQKAVKLNRP